jgi:sporulation related protein
MRTLFFLLLFINVAFAFYIQLSEPVSRDSIPPPPELHPEKIRSLSTATNCLEWGSFIEADLDHVQAALARQQLASMVNPEAAGKVPVYWIHIPPLKNKHHAQKKMDELGKLGIATYSLVQEDSKWNNAISMGFFHKIEEAQNRMASLRSKGVRSAVIGARNLEQMKFVVYAPSQEITEKMAELKQEFPGSELKTINCQAPEKKPEDAVNK